MKQFFFLSILVTVVAFTSCKKDKDTTDPADTHYHLNLSALTVQADAAAGSTNTISVEANSSWKVTLPSGIDWLTVNKTTGNGNENFQISVTRDNITGVKRTAVVTVSLDNGKAPAKQVTVEQDFIVTNPVTIDWKKVLGGNGNDYGYSIIKTTDGGYFVSGRTSSNNSGDVGPTRGGIDMWVIKLDGSGSIVWQKTLGGNSDEYSVSAASTPDGGYVLTGFTVSNNNGDVGANHGNMDFWVVKINGSGGLIWQKTLGGSGDDRPYAVTVTTEGRIAVAGSTSSNNNGDVGFNHGSEDMWVVILDNANGSFILKKTFGGNGSEIAKALVPAPDGGLFAGGSTTSNNNGDVGIGKGSSDFWILRLDRNLSVLWKNSLGGSNMEDLHALGVSNNELIAAGSSKSNNSGDVGTGKGGEDIWVVKMDATTGALGWQKQIGGSGNDVAKGLVVRTNGNIIVAGYTYSHNSGDVGTSHGAGDYWVVQLNSAGNTGWKKLLGGDDEDLAAAIAESGDGVTIVGSTMSKNSGDVGAAHGNSEVWVVKLKE